MDGLIVVLVVFIAAMIKSKVSGGIYIGRQPVLRESGEMDYLTTENIPIGNNLMLNREASPFMLIVRQLGLV